MQIFEDKVKKSKHRYAGIWKRTFSRIFDFLFVSVVSFIFFILCFINQINELFSQWDENTSKLDTWRVCLATGISTFLLFFYFYIIPYITKGYTIFKKAFKIRLHTNERHLNFFWLIFKHEFLLTFFVIAFNVILIILIAASNQPILVVKFISSITYDEKLTNLIKQNIAISTVSFIIKAGYILSCFLPFVIFFHMWFNKNKPALHDKFSSTFVYELEEYKPNISIKTPKEITINELSLAPGLSAQKPKENNQIIDEKVHQNNILDNFLVSCEERSILKNLETRQKELDKLDK